MGSGELGDGHNNMGSECQRTQGSKRARQGPGHNGVHGGHGAVLVTGAQVAGGGQLDDCCSIGLGDAEQLQGEQAAHEEGQGDEGVGL